MQPQGSARTQAHGTPHRIVWRPAGAGSPRSWGVLLVLDGIGAGIVHAETGPLPPSPYGARARGAAEHLHATAGIDPHRTLEALTDARLRQVARGHVLEAIAHARVAIDHGDPSDASSILRRLQRELRDAA